MISALMFICHFLMTFFMWICPVLWGQSHISKTLIYSLSCTVILHTLFPSNFFVAHYRTQMKLEVLPTLWTMAHLIFYFLKSRLIQIFQIWADKRQTSISAWMHYLTSYSSLHYMGNDLGMLISGYESMIKERKRLKKNNLPRNLGITFV